MNEWDAFDRGLAESLTELPPSGDTVRAVTPWREAMNRIVLGLCLTCFTLNFALLDHILPAIGAVELYLGFRTLRKDNQGFQLGWIFSICKAVILYLTSVLYATPYAGFLSVPPMVSQAALTLLLFAALRKALRQAAARLGHSMERDPVLWALLWYSLIIALALFYPQPGWLAGGVILISFVCIIRSLVKAADELDACGYAVQPTPVRVSASHLKLAYYGSLLALIFICSLFFSHVRLDGTEIEQNSAPTETAAVQKHLLALGLPREILAYLPPEELEKLADASACEYRANELTDTWNTELDGRPFTTSGAMVYLGGGTARFYVLAEYSDGINAFWQNLTEFKNSGTVRWDGACYLTYRKGGAMYRTSVPVEETRETVDNFFTASTYETRIRARYSFPAGARDRACLFACTLQLSEWEHQNPDGVYYYHDCIVNFYRRRTPSGYPYRALAGDSSTFKDLAQYCQHFEFLLPRP